MKLLKLVIYNKNQHYRIKVIEARQVDVDILYKVEKLKIEANEGNFIARYLKREKYSHIDFLSIYIPHSQYKTI